MGNNLTLLDGLEKGNTKKVKALLASGKFDIHNVDQVLRAFNICIFIYAVFSYLWLYVYYIKISSLLTNKSIIVWKQYLIWLYIITD